MKALVVDDSRAIRMIVSQILKECGFEVSEARHVMKPFTRAVIEDELRLVGLAA
jgi:DNA-binding response OmpR family regulator